MDPERIQRIQDLYHSARERGLDRDAFLAEATEADEDLVRKVADLLAADRPEGPLDRPVLDLAGPLLARGELAAGTRFGHYTILARLGTGGMGDVYRARDTRLARVVALKTLREPWQAEDGSAGRFWREARAASALNHPNIVTIHDVGEAEGFSFIVMELIQGQTLREVLAEGALPVPKLLALATQIADALAAAHAKGIVHRDLKPANIMVTPEGRVKVLDFGLAKRGPADSAGDAASVTLESLTRTGTVVGTCGYMSPEQARAQALDFRTDQFSFGAMLYEMATGRRAFRGATEMDALAAVMRDEPEPVRRVNPQVPDPLQWVVERCLAKSREERYASTRDLLEDLGALGQNISQARGAAAPRIVNLPAQRTSVVGRDRELAEVRDAILDGDRRLVTLTGPGGIGKTRLAVEAARQLTGEFPGGVVFVPLDHISDPELVLSEVANAMKVRQTADFPVARLLEEHVSQFCPEPTLLVLDNFEHVVAAAPMVTNLLSASERLKAIVTSRAPLRVYGEYEYAVPSLALPKGEGARALARSPAVSLFLERATALRAGARPMEGRQVRLIAEICERLDGLPLAIELAAARTKVLALPELLERLKKPLHLLAGGPRDVPERQRTLRATLDWSYQLLDPEQQKLFRRLSVFVGGATHEGIEAVCNAKGDIGLDFLGALEALIDNSLLWRVAEEGAEPRFAMLETMREYSSERLAEAGEDGYTHKAHAAYCVVLAEDAASEFTGAQWELWFARLDAEAGNMRAALDWLTDSQEAQWGLRLCSAMEGYWRERGLQQEGCERLEKLLALPTAAARNRVRGWALGTVGDLLPDGREHSPRVIKSYREGLEILEEIGDVPGMLRAHSTLGLCYTLDGNFADSRRHHKEAVKLARQTGDPSAVAVALSNLAENARVQEEYEMARQLHAEASHLFEAAGNQAAVTWAISHQADLARDAGDAPQARTLYERALNEFRRLEERSGIACCHFDLAVLDLDTESYASAEARLTEALKTFSDLGYPRDFPRVLDALACCAAASSQPERALTLAGGAAAVRRLSGLTVNERGGPRHLRAVVEQSLNGARSELPASNAAESWMRGWNMSPQEAVAFALS